jgi:hypothetical protein
VDSGAIAADTTGIKIATISQQIAANTLYYLAVVSDGAATATIVTPWVAPFGVTDASDAQGRSSLTRAFTYGALPATWGTQTGYLAAVFSVVLRAV